MTKCANSASVKPSRPVPMSFALKVWGGGLGGSIEPKGAPKGPKSKIMRHQDDLLRGSNAKVTKTVILSSLLKGSPREPWKQNHHPHSLCSVLGGLDLKG